MRRTENRANERPAFFERSARLSMENVAGSVSHGVHPRHAPGLAGFRRRRRANGPGMRKRAKTEGAPNTATPTPATEAAAPTKTKYEELVEVLVDGLFEIMMTEPPHCPDRTKRRRGGGGRGGIP